MLKTLRLFLRCPVKEPLCHAPLDKRPAQRYVECGVLKWEFGMGWRNRRMLKSWKGKRRAHSSDKTLCLVAPFLTLCYCFPLLFLLFLLDARIVRKLILLLTNCSWHRFQLEREWNQSGGRRMGRHHGARGKMPGQPEMTPWAMRWRWLPRIVDEMGEDVFATQGNVLKSSQIGRECGENVEREKNNEAIKSRLRYRDTSFALK